VRRIVVLDFITHISLHNAVAGAPGENNGVIREEDNASPPKPNPQSLPKGQIITGVHGTGQLCSRF
jgi:hypothetical protein